MTSVDYRDMDNNLLNEEHFWKQETVTDMVKKVPISEIVKERIDSFQIVVSDQEAKIRKDIEARGGKVVKIISQPINKRRYKRNVAKQMKRYKQDEIVY